ncbi:hypothetical protein K7X08_012742 [Anisodus acutangulus]|uniref:AMP-binding enzyme C-terminal domain-containing protein n=1 Tax=Anisodus acutangulus TaxID=402998 RepID=A0A9Q1RGV5_9SOLA|nr:hypothetical protein K7X08_012742 [Anisodus acutangulus]
MTGGEPPPQVLFMMEELGFGVTYSYGLTETYGPGTVCTWKPEWSSLSPDEQAKIKARQGLHHIGMEEVDVKDPATMKSISPDAITMGEIELKNRSKDIIISGGENISTIEVESVLFSHPAILEAAVVGRPDDYWGETPCAFVKLKDGNNATADEIIKYCRGRLPHYMSPKTVIFDDLPETWKDINLF